MFVDYVGLLLINTMIGYFLLAAYVYRGLDDPLDRRWAPSRRAIQKPIWPPRRGYSQERPILCDR